MRWLCVASLIFAPAAFGQVPTYGIGVGRLTANVIMFYSIRMDESRSLLDAAVLMRLRPDTRRTHPDGFHSGGGAEIGSHSVYFDSASRALWTDGNLLLRLNDHNVAILYEALEPGESPSVIGEATTRREISDHTPPSNQDVREALLASSVVREYLAATR